MLILGIWQVANYYPSGVASQPQPTTTVQWKAEYNSYLKEPLNVAVWRNYVIVTDVGRNSVVKIDTLTGKAVHLGEGKPQVKWQYPYGLAVQGNVLYVSDSRRKSVETFNLLSDAYTGSIFEGTDGTKPGLMVCDQTGNLWISDLQFKRVLKLNSQGKVLANFGEGYLLHPQGLAVTKQNTILVADEARGEVFEISGQSDKQIHKLITKSGRLDLMRDLEISGEKLYATLPLTGKITVFNLQGKSLGNLINKELANSIPMGMTVLPQGKLLIADRANSRLMLLDPLGNKSTMK